MRASRGSEIDVTAQVLQGLTQNLLVIKVNISDSSHNRKHHMEPYNTVSVYNNDKDILHICRTGPVDLPCR